MNITITNFKKLTTAKIVAQLPITITSSGKAIAEVTTPKVTAPTTTEPTSTDIKSYWLVGGSNTEVAATIEQAFKETQLPVFVTYNAPYRDNGSYSAGGQNDPQAYYSWLGTVGATIGDRKCIIIHEPDYSGLSWNLSTDEMWKHWEYLSVGIDILKKQPNIKLYLNMSDWISEDKQTQMFKEIINRRAKGQQIDGFALNVSGYTDLKTVTAYGDKYKTILGMNYVIDTSRNGNGNPHAPNWCNVTDTKIGEKPKLNPTSNCDAYLWVKVPGESDGLGINDDGSHPRNDVPAAGTMWSEYRDAIYSGDWKNFKAKHGIV